MWEHQVRSLLGQTPVSLKGGRGVVSFSARQGAIAHAEAKRAEAKSLVLSSLHHESWSKVSEILLTVRKDRAFVFRMLMQMVKNGEIEGVQQSGSKRVWYFRKKSVQGSIDVVL